MPAVDAKAAATEPPIVFDNVSLRFDRNANLTIDRIDLTVERGRFVSVIGPSGCGKSTLLNLSAGLLAPTGGEVRYIGEPLTRINTDIGYITQDPNLLP
ncbi:MAG TPA: ATP-binding cassette domain-containing protein, partial [Pseudonocardiaceae bacterium]|nr:ATP-binding cassette domain-containing protein [Pseudonocardiaceae bacterium]